LAFSSNGSLLAVGTYKQLHIFDLATGTKRTTSEPRGYVRAVAFGGPNDSLIAALDDNGHAQVFASDDLQRIATVRGPENWVNAVGFAGEKQLLVGDYDGHVFLWDIDAAAKSGFLPGEWNSNKNRKPAPAEAVVRDLNQYAVAGQKSIAALAVRNGLLYYGCADKALHIVDLQSGATKMKLEGHGSTVSCFDFLDDNHVVTGSFDKLVRIFNLRTGRCLATIEGHTHTIWDIVALGPGQFLTASDDDQIRRFHVDWELEP
jgi:WD40 repeat protein